MARRGVGAQQGHPAADVTAGLSRIQEGGLPIVAIGGNGSFLAMPIRVFS